MGAKKTIPFLCTQSYVGPIHFQVKTGMDVHFVNPLEEPGPIQVRVIRQVDSPHGYRTDGRTSEMGLWIRPALRKSEEEKSRSNGRCIIRRARPNEISISPCH